MVGTNHCMKDKEEADILNRSPGNARKINMHTQHRMTLGWKRKGRKKGLYTGWERPTLIQQIGPATKNPPPTCMDKIPTPLGPTTKLPPEEEQKREERKTAGPLMILVHAK